MEKENKYSRGWFLRFIWIHVVGPDRKVGIISDRHQGILSMAREQILRYAQLHHRWCTGYVA